jgi:hypothetical protein
MIKEQNSSPQAEPEFQLLAKAIFDPLGYAQQHGLSGEAVIGRIYKQLRRSLFSPEKGRTPERITQVENFASSADRRDGHFEENVKTAFRELIRAELVIATASREGVASPSVTSLVQKSHFCTVRGLEPYSTPRPFKNTLRSLAFNDSEGNPFSANEREVLKAVLKAVFSALQDL